MTTALIAFLIIAVLVFYKVSKSKQHKAQPVEIKEDQKQVLERYVAFYKALEPTEQLRFMGLVQDFLKQVTIEAVGFELTEADRLLVASGAVIPVFGFKDWQYRNLTNVLLYPDTFNKQFQFEGGDRNVLGMVGSGFLNGQMILSRRAMYQGFEKAKDGQNTAIHEFVHLIDNSDGATDGLPENLVGEEFAEPWQRIMKKEMAVIRANKSDIDSYALTNEAEFLAVTSEYFFERPQEMQRRHPELFELLTLVYDKRRTGTHAESPDESNAGPLAEPGAETGEEIRTASQSASTFRQPLVDSDESTM
ncbi:MAG: M90 family metallopeptidase [Bacteroidota bacterium]